MHGELKAAAEPVDLLERAQALLGVRRDRLFAGNQQVCIRMPMGTADAAAQLIELRQAKFIGTIDDDRVGVGKIEPRLDDRRTNQDLGFVVEKVEHDFFQLPWSHLAVRHGDFRFRHQIGELERQTVDGFDPVMQKENLAATLELA